jgi:hypothetical protein
MLKKAFFVLAVVFGVSFANAQSQFDLDVNSNSFEFGLGIYLNDYYMLDDSSKYYGQFNYLVNEYTFKATRTVISAGLKVMNSMPNSDGLLIGVGADITMADNDDNVPEEVMALPIGIYLDYDINEMLYLSGSINYAPRVLTFLDGKTYSKHELVLSYRALANGDLYIGTRSVKVDSVSNSYKINDDFFFGFRVLF